MPEGFPGEWLHWGSQGIGTSCREGYIGEGGRERERERERETITNLNSLPMMPVQPLNMMAKMASNLSIPSFG